MLTLAIALSLLVAVGVVLTTVQTLLTVAFRRRTPKGPRTVRPFVSILKPLCGVDDELEANLHSFAALEGVRYELIVSVADPDDPALAVVERVRAAHPALDCKVVIGGDALLEHGNRKVARLIAARAHARGEILVISDSNVRTEADALANTLAAFDDAEVGCVSNLFTGSRARSFGASLEVLHLLGFVVPGSVIAAFAGVPCVVGKSMAITTRALDAIGGFERFARVLAEDQAIGLAVREAGLRVMLSPVVVRNVVVQRTVRRALDRQIRWNKIRYAFSKSTYSAEFLINPLPFAIAAACIGAPLSLAIAVAAIRIAQMFALDHATGARLRARELAMTPLLDLLMFAAQFVAYVDDTVTWRGYTLQIGPGTELV